jgi:hypothetical protein
LVRYSAGAVGAYILDRFIEIPVAVSAKRSWVLKNKLTTVSNRSLRHWAHGGHPSDLLEIISGSDWICKKFVLGLTLGIALTATTVVYASDTIQAVRQVFINGHLLNTNVQVSDDVMMERQWLQRELLLRHLGQKWVGTDNQIRSK